MIKQIEKERGEKTDGDTESEYDDREEETTDRHHIL